MNEAAALAIVKYIQEYLFEPKCDWPLYWFERRSYSRWAAHEILELVMDHPMIPPDAIIEEFMIKMDLYSSVAEDTKASFIFLIAKEISEDLLRLFL